MDDIDNEDVFAFLLDKWSLRVEPGEAKTIFKLTRALDEAVTLVRMPLSLSITPVMRLHPRENDETSS